MTLNNASIKSLVFIDSAVEDYEILTGGLSIDAEIVILGPDEDGVCRIAQKLSQHRQLDSLHIISHGAPGALHLGNTTLSIDTFERHIPQLLAWSAALAPQRGCTVIWLPGGCGRGGRGVFKAVSSDSPAFSSRFC